MIKTLLLLRHAKSSWKLAELEDHDRPLNARGRNACAFVGRHLAEKSLAPDLVLCSTATRTRQTAELVFAEFQAEPEIDYRDDLYHADPAGIVAVLMQIAQPATCVMVIAHNPGLEEFLTQQTGEIQPFPTAAVAQLDYELDTWAHFKLVNKGLLVRLWRPRKPDSDLGD